MNGRIEAAAKALEGLLGYLQTSAVRYDWTRTASEALAAADAVMFSDEVVDRLAEAIAEGVQPLTKWADLDPTAQDVYRQHVRAIIHVLKGDDA